MSEAPPVVAPVVDEVDSLKHKEWSKAFSFFDRSKSGAVSISDLGLILQSLDFRPTSEELKDIEEELCYDTKGLIREADFLVVAGKFDREDALKDKLTTIFSYFDYDENGYLDLDDLHTRFTTTGPIPLSEAEWEALLAELKPTSYGDIKLEEFVKTIMYKGKPNEPL